MGTKNLDAKMSYSLDTEIVSGLKAEHLPTELFKITLGDGAKEGASSRHPPPHPSDKACLSLGSPKESLGQGLGKRSSIREGNQESKSETENLPLACN